MLNIYPKIDIHCHTTDRPLKHTVSSDASLQAIENEATKYNVQRTLLLATYFPHRSSGISNYRLRSWIDNWKNNYLHHFLMFGSLDFEHYFYQGFNELEEMARRETISGIKIYAGYQKIDPSKLQEVMKLASTFKLPVMFHTGDCTHMSNTYADVEEFDYLVEQYEYTNFIYSHMCNPKIDKIIERVKRYKNVYTDISGLLHSGRDDHELPEHVASVRRFYDSCGIDQLMWGTDFPVQTHEHAIYLAEQALHNHANPEELVHFYHATAARILKLQ